PARRRPRSRGIGRRLPPVWESRITNRLTLGSPVSYSSRRDRRDCMHLSHRVSHAAGVVHGSTARGILTPTPRVECRLMQGPEPFPPSERSETTGAWPVPGATPTPNPTPTWERDDPPTVRSGSTVRRVRLVGSEGVVPFPEAGTRIDSFELEEA